MKRFFGILMVFVLVATLSVTAWAEKKKALSLPKDWMNYKHIGSLVIPDKSSPLFGIHHFYMNKKGLKAFEKGVPYPDGTIIVGGVYEVVTGGEGSLNEGKRLFNTYMRKDSKAEAAKETGGWIFAAFTPDGKLMEKDVKKDCFECHMAVKDSDYVFSKPLK